jgi:hypothetical protein
MLGAMMYAMLWGSLYFLRAIGWWRWSVKGLDRLPPRQTGGHDHRDEPYQLARHPGDRRTAPVCLPTLVVGKERTV